MPANLPRQYFETEKKLRTAKTPQEKISILEELLSIVPKHKGTEKLQGLLKTKIAKLKSQVQKKRGVSKHGQVFWVEKAGAGQVILLGAPNSGKSMLVRSLTNAKPEIGDYPFTTRTPFPAMMQYENIQIQLIDTPPITADYMEPWLPELIKVSDGVLLLLDVSNTNPIQDFFSISAKLKEKNIEFLPDGQDISLEIPLFQKKALIIATKKDLSSADKNFIALKQALHTKHEPILISAIRGDNLEYLKKMIFSFLQILRVYSKIPGKKVDYNAPFIFKKGSSLMDMAKAVHKDFSQKLKFARIWGKNKYQGQKVNRDYILEDEDIIELHL